MNRNERLAMIRGRRPSTVSGAIFSACSFRDEPCTASNYHGLHCVCGGLGRVLSVVHDAEPELIALEPDEHSALVETFVHEN